MTNLFVGHFKHFLPDIFISIKDKLTEIDDELTTIGSSLVLDQSSLALVNNFINKLSDDTKNTFSATMKKQEDNMVSFKLSTLNSEIFEDLLEKRKPSTFIKEERLLEIMKRSEGHNLSGFPSTEVIKMYMDEEAADILNEIDEYYDSIYNLIRENLFKRIEETTIRFPDLSDKFEELVGEFLNEVFC